MTKAEAPPDRASSERMSLVEAIHTRRAVRSYTPTPVASFEIDELLEAAVQAPSAVNRQPWSFVIVQDRERLARYSRRAKQLLLATAPDAKSSAYAALLRDDSFNVFYDAGTLVVICAPTADAYASADAWLAAQNLMLAAHAMGLGTCPIGFAVPWLATPEARGELGIPPAQLGLAPIIVGRPAGVSPEVPRARPRILTWIR